MSDLWDDLEAESRTPGAYMTITKAQYAALLDLRSDAGLDFEEMRNVAVDRDKWRAIVELAENYGHARDYREAEPGMALMRLNTLCSRITDQP